MKKVKIVSGYLIVQFNARELKANEGTALGAFGVIDPELYTGHLDVDRSVMEYDDAGTLAEAVSLAAGLGADLEDLPEPDEDQCPHLSAPCPEIGTETPCAQAVAVLAEQEPHDNQMSMCVGCPLRGHEKDIESLFVLLEDITTLNAIEVVTVPYKPAADRDVTDDYIFRTHDRDEPDPKTKKLLEYQAYRHKLIQEVREYLREQDALLDASGKTVILYGGMADTAYRAKRKSDAVKAVLARRREDAQPHSVTSPS